MPKRAFMFRTQSAVSVAGSAKRRDDTPISLPQRVSVRIVILDLFAIVPYYTARLCKSLAEAGVGTVLVSMTYDLDPACFRRTGVRNNPGLVDIIGARRIKSPFLRRTLKAVEGCINMALLLGRFLVSKPGIVHVQQLAFVDSGIPFELWLLRAASRQGVKTVVTVHNLLPHDSEDRYRRVYTQLYRSADALICHTADAADRLTLEFGVPRANIWTIPHGPLFHHHDTGSGERIRRQLGIGARDCLVVFQGFIKPYKGLPFLLEAWRSVQQRWPAARLLIAGGGEDAEIAAVKDAVSALGITESVILMLSYITADQVQAIYAAADVMVYPYRQITTSGALMTGIATRKPIIASDLPAFRDVLTAGYNAELVEYGDTPALAEALSGLISSPARRSELCHRLPHCDDGVYSWNNIAAETARCYDFLLAG